MSIIISQLRDHSISVDQSRYVTSVVANYLDTVTIEQNSNFHKTSLLHDMILTKEYASTSDENVGLLSI